MSLYPFSTSSLRLCEINQVILCEWLHRGKNITLVWIETIFLFLKKDSYLIIFLSLMCIQTAVILVLAQVLCGWQTTLQHGDKATLLTIHGKITLLTIHGKVILLTIHGKITLPTIHDKVTLLTIHGDSYKLLSSLTLAGHDWH